MKYLILFLAVVIFVSIWTVITNKFLPTSVVDGKKKDKYDERQSQMFTEILAKTAVWIVYILIINIILRNFGYWGMKDGFFTKQPELVYLIGFVVLFGTNFFVVRKKYTSKGV